MFPLLLSNSSSSLCFGSHLPDYIPIVSAAHGVSVCSYQHPTLLLSSAASQSLAANAPSDLGAWDSCFQQRHPWQVDSSLPASSWVAGFRPLSSQNESCLLRARAGWLRAHTSCTTQLLTGAGIDTGKKLKLPLSFAVLQLQQVCTCPLRKGRTDFTTCVTTLSEIPQEETHR